jgi:hypothetical protein
MVSNCQVQRNINKPRAQPISTVTKSGGHALQPKRRFVWLLGAGTLNGHAYDGSCDRLVCELHVVVSLVEPPCRLLCHAHLQITHPQHPAETAQVAQEAPVRPADLPCQRWLRRTPRPEPPHPPMLVKKEQSEHTTNELPSLFAIPIISAYEALIQ